MFNQKIKLKKRTRRRKRVRSKVMGTQERPRLSIRCSSKNFYVQVIDDTQGKTLVAISTLDKGLKQSVPFGGNVTAAKAVGELLSKKAKEKSISKVVLDKGPYHYHGRVKSFADSARAGGLEF